MHLVVLARGVRVSTGSCSSRGVGAEVGDVAAGSHRLLPAATPGWVLWSTATGCASFARVGPATLVHGTVPPSHGVGPATLVHGTATGGDAGWVPFPLRGAGDSDLGHCVHSFHGALPTQPSSCPGARQAVVHIFYTAVDGGLRRNPMCRGDEWPGCARHLAIPPRVAVFRLGSSTAGWHPERWAFCWLGIGAHWLELTLWRAWRLGGLGVRTRYTHTTQPQLAAAAGSGPAVVSSASAQVTSCPCMPLGESQGVMGDG